MDDILRYLMSGETKIIHGLTPLEILTDDFEIENIAGDFENYSKTIANMIVGSTPKYTIGVYGEWGTGKTTLMKSVRRKFSETDTENENEWIPTVWFNAWRFEQEKTNATVPLILEILGRLVKRIVENEESKKEKLADRLKKAFSYIENWNIHLSLPVIIGELGIDVGGSASEHKKFEMSNKPSITEGLELINELKTKISTDIPELKLVVFVDDLDRCSPKKALQLFESIKILLDIPGIVFVIGMSHETVSKLISAEYKDSEIKGDHYIRKIIQVPINIPPWSIEDVNGLIDKMVNKLTNPNFDFVNTKSLIAKVVETNPRELKRFINNLIVIWEVFPEKGKLSNEGLIVVEALKNRWNEFYRLIIINEKFRTKIKKFSQITSEERFIEIEKYKKGLQSIPKVIKKTAGGRKEYDFQPPDEFGEWILRIPDSLWEFLTDPQIRDIIKEIENWDDYRRATETVKDSIKKTPDGKQVLQSCFTCGRELDQDQICYVCDRSKSTEINPDVCSDCGEVLVQNLCPIHDENELAQLGYFN